MADQQSEKSCPVCRDVMDISAIGVCDHPVCYVCSTRLRAICEQNVCSICRTDNLQIFYTRQIRTYANLKSVASNNFLRDTKHGIYFDSDSVQFKFMQLLEHRCALCSDIKPFNSFKSLCDHMKREHNLHHCEICLQHLKLFSYERKFYTREELAHHKRVGDKNDRAYRGHPLCKFCDKRYLDPDELSRHLRKEHYFCQFCDADGQETNVVFGDYSYLRMHFLQRHFLCEEGDCANVHFTNAFRSEIDLKAHSIAVHGKSMRRSEARQTRTIEIDFGSVLQTQRGERLRTADVRGAKSSRFRREHNEHYHSDQSRNSRAKAYESEDAEAYLAMRQSRNDAQAERSTRNDTEEGRSRVAAENRPRDAGEGRPRNTGESRPRDAADNRPRDVAEIKPKDVAQQKKDKTAEEKQDVSSNDSQADYPILSREEKQNATASSLGVSTKPKGMTRIQTEPLLDTLAKRLAMASGHSVQEGHLVEEDFPSLGGISKKNSGQGIKTASGWKSSVMSASSLRVVDVVENFPSLSLDYSQRKKENSKFEDTKVNNKYKNSDNVDNYAARQNNNKILENKKGVNLNVDEKRLENYIKLNDKSSKQNNNLENSNSGGHSNVANKTVDFTLQKEQSKSKKQSSNKTVKKKMQSDLNNYERTDFTDNMQSMVSVKGVVGNKENTGETSNSNEDSSQNVSNKKKKSEKAQASTKTIAKAAKQTSNTAIENGVGKQDLNEKAPVNELKSKDSVQTLNNYATVSTSDHLSMSSPLSSLFNNSSTMTSLSSAASDNSSVLNIASAIANGPAVVPPPGFQPPLASKLFQTRAPPGLSAPPVITPPPGFSQVKEEKYAVGDVLAEKSSGISFSYVMPPKCDNRNKELIAKIQVLRPEKFDAFKSFSGKFRKSEINANVYYENCKQLLGDELFAEIFIELLVLLPDIEKQGELLSVHRKASGGKRIANAAWKTSSFDVVTCGVCSQVVTNDDINNHRSAHRKDMDFPPLALHV